MKTQQSPVTYAKPAFSNLEALFLWRISVDDRPSDALEPTGS